MSQLHVPLQHSTTTRCWTKRRELTIMSNLRWTYAEVKACIASWEGLYLILVLLYMYVMSTKNRQSTRGDMPSCSFLYVPCCWQEQHDTSTTVAQRQKSGIVPWAHKREAHDCRQASLKGRALMSPFASHCSIVETRACEHGGQEQSAPLDPRGCVFRHSTNFIQVYLIIPMFTHARQVPRSHNSDHPSPPEAHLGYCCTTCIICMQA